MTMTEPSQPPDMKTLIAAVSTSLHNRLRTPPAQIYNVSLAAFGYPSAAAATALPPAITKPLAGAAEPPAEHSPKHQTQTHAQEQQIQVLLRSPLPSHPFVKALGSTTEEMDAFFLPATSSAPVVDEEYVLKPPPKQLPPRQIGDARTMLDGWMGGYKHMSPCQLPGPVKETVVGSDGAEVKRWLKLRVDQELIGPYLQEIFGSYTEPEHGGQNTDGSQDGNGIQVDPKQKGKEVENGVPLPQDDGIQNETAVEGPEEEQEQRGDSRQNGETTNSPKMDKRERLKETIRRIKRSLMVRRRPRMRERRDQTPGPSGRRNL